MRLAYYLAITVHLFLMVLCAACMPYLRQPGYLALVMGWSIWSGARSLTQLQRLKKIRA